ncbi:MAG: glycosyl hydrolase family 30, partial [Bacteroidota bacterium]
MRGHHFIFRFVILFFFISSCSSTEEFTVHWVASSPDAQWQTETLQSLAGDADSQQLVRVYPDKLLQNVDGFGACFNELGWEALQVLPEGEQQEILNALFSQEDGCKFSICRMPIGANDYAVDWYSHNEVDGDFEMDNFSLERDAQRLIPYIQKAQAINPNIQIWASPWAPPAWMKTNKHYACRPDVVNDLPEEGRGEEMVTQFIMEEEYLDAYALYFSKFIGEYQRQGIDIYAVHVQNEPNSCQNFPSCVWRPEDLATFIGGHLGPKFAQQGLDTEIWLGTIERAQPERVDAILQSPTAREYVSGVGFQWAGKGAIPHVNATYLDLKLMQTETECGNGSNDWAAAEYTFSLMKHYFANGANTYLYWNMILDETGKSQWGWKQNSMITINTDTKQVTYNPEFYLMKHFSAFVEPGAHTVKTNDENCLAFSTDTAYTLIYYNMEDAEVNKQFAIGDRVIRYLLGIRVDGNHRVL